MRVAVIGAYLGHPSRPTEPVEQFAVIQAQLAVQQVGPVCRKPQLPILFFHFARLVLQVANKAVGVVTEALEALDAAREQRFFLDLFGDEPLQEDLRGRVAFLRGQLQQCIDLPGQFAFVGQRRAVEDVEHPPDLDHMPADRAVGLGDAFVLGIDLTNQSADAIDRLGDPRDRRLRLGTCARTVLDSTDEVVERLLAAAPSAADVLERLESDQPPVEERLLELPVSVYGGG